MLAVPAGRLGTLPALACPRGPAAGLAHPPLGAPAGRCGDNRPWAQRGAGRSRGTPRARRLLTLLAPAVRIEPGLLSALRLSLADSAFDASVEAGRWQDPAVASTHSEAATLNPKMAADLRTAFAAEPPGVQRWVMGYRGRRD